MTNRPRYTTDQLARFITLARGGRDRRTAALLDDDERNTVPVTDSLGREQMTFAADLCAVLEIGRQQDATRYLDADEKGVTTTDTLGGEQAVTLPTTTPEDNT